MLAGFKAPETIAKQVKAEQQTQANSLEGAWRLTSKTKNAAETITTVKIVQDGFFTVAVFDERNKKFVGTYGGTYTIANGQLTEKYEFNTFDSTQVGKSKTGKSTLKSNTWQTTGLGQQNRTENWEKVNETKAGSPLAGTWRITGREQNGQMNTMRPGPRKTLKVLSGTRFQWIAFNSETGEFSGTGGGTYTAKDGKYTENIEFFSRDSSRVGMQLSFNFEVRNGKWHHSGQSSTGKPVNEIWERIAGN
ncbi:membrane or secreted protein [Pontibacter sp. BT327]|uniref:Membrane or secreted protein n=1 Tax=Pontibacter burrus TaxID=2704466 RepID=A0A6B3LY80_9BACT|nr:membrane or secreted protein [Pontibacter burrus]